MTALRVPPKATRGEMPSPALIIEIRPEGRPLITAFCATHEDELALAAHVRNQLGRPSRWGIDLGGMLEMWLAFVDEEAS